MFSILLAEGEENLRKLMQKNLELRGYSVTGCRDGVQALEVFETGQFNLLTTDIMMPDMDGIALVVKVREI